MPTNLPTIEANEMRLDNLFRLEDNSIALIDYESVYKEEDKIKYLNYVVRTLRRKKIFEEMNQIIRVIIIYTGDIKREHTKARLDVGCLQFVVEEVFLSELDAECIENDLYNKITNGELLTEEEQMQFVILPLIYAGKRQKQKCIQRCFDMAKQIESSQQQIFLLSGLLVFTDKIIIGEDSERIKRWISMTKVGQLYEEEKQQALRIVNEEKQQALREIKEKSRQEKQQVIRKAKHEKMEAVKFTKKQQSRKIARRMLQKGLSITEVQSFITNLSYEEIEELK